MTRAVWQFRARRQKARRRYLLPSALLAVGAATVLGVQLMLADHEATPLESADMCPPDSLPAATVKLQAAVAVDG